MVRTATIIGLVAMVGGARSAAAEVQFTQDHRGNTTSVTGLVSDADSEGCGLRPISGRVVKRAFNKAELLPTGFVLEARDGTRIFVSIALDNPDHWNEATQRAVLPGLQRLTKPGRLVHGKVFSCGTAEILTLQTIR
jgi:hypothetical protein